MRANNAEATSKDVFLALVETVADLRRRVAQLEVNFGAALTAVQVLNRVADEAEQQEPERQRDRHGMHLVKGGEH